MTGVVTRDPALFNQTAPRKPHPGNDTRETTKSCLTCRPPFSKLYFTRLIYLPQCGNNRQFGRSARLEIMMGKIPIMRYITGSN
jgi:hypothetical protein